MINTDHGIISWHGNNIELMADLSVIVHMLCYDVLMSGSDMTLGEAMLRIMHAVELRTRTEEEFERERERELYENGSEPTVEFNDLMKRMGDQ